MPVRDNVGLGLLAALVAGLVACGIYGAVRGGIEREVGWAATDVFLNEFGPLTEAWNEGKDAMTFLFIALATFAAFSAAKKSAR
ncbi:hypothetical protein [Streptomyces sp. c-19]|uniref:hypothetical protein n=1 Tax=Streptomyces sp. c-19 TaxID=2789275 RepID=UPI0039814DAE